MQQHVVWRSTRCKRTGKSGRFRTLHQKRPLSNPHEAERITRSGTRALKKLAGLGTGPQNHLGSSTIALDRWPRLEGDADRLARVGLYDNMNHAGFLDYARHAGFVIKLCRPYRTRTKGQVKRFNVCVRSAPSYPPRSGPLGALFEHTPDSAVTESRGQTGAGSD